MDEAFWGGFQKEAVSMKWVNTKRVNGLVSRLERNPTLERAADDVLDRHQSLKNKKIMDPSSSFHAQYHSGKGGSKGKTSLSSIHPEEREHIRSEISELNRATKSGKGNVPRKQGNLIQMFPRK